MYRVTYLIFEMKSIVLLYLNMVIVREPLNDDKIQVLYDLMNEVKVYSILFEIWVGQP